VNAGEQRARMIILIVNGVAALAASVCLLIVLGGGLHGVPALGRRLVPDHASHAQAAVGARHHPRTQVSTDSFGVRRAADL
jgi:hypothetical protein